MEWWGPYKWPSQWVTGVITPEFLGVERWCFRQAKLDTLVLPESAWAWTVTWWWKPKIGEGKPFWMGKSWVKSEKAHLKLITHRETCILSRSWHLKSAWCSSDLEPCLTSFLFTCAITFGTSNSKEKTLKMTPSCKKQATLGCYTAKWEIFMFGCWEGSYNLKWEGLVCNQQVWFLFKSLLILWIWVGENLIY